MISPKHRRVVLLARNRSPFVTSKMNPLQFSRHSRGVSVLAYGGRFDVRHQDLYLTYPFVINCNPWVMHVNVSAFSPCWLVNTVNKHKSNQSCWLRNDVRPSARQRSLNDRFDNSANMFYDWLAYSRTRLGSGVLRPCISDRACWESRPSQHWK